MTLPFGSFFGVPVFPFAVFRGPVPFLFVAFARTGDVLPVV
jgi:hypothetical protein